MRQVLVPKSALSALAPLLPFLLSLLGLVLITVAAFTFAVWAGLLAAGVAALVLGYVLEVGDGR